MKKFFPDAGSALIYMLAALMGIVLWQGCASEGSDGSSSDKATKVERKALPTVNKDSLYHFVAKQVNFGPRYVNSEGHRACRDWLAEKLGSYGWEVQLQDFEARAYTGDILKGSNIIASWNPEVKRRVLLTAHWDTRHIADYDPDEERRQEPILGADDGGSGVAVLLEIARLIPQQNVGSGVDIVLFDAEDYGNDNGQDSESWGLGSQHWSKNLHNPGYTAEFGILLDMVGSKGARFPKEGISMQFAPQVVDKVWKTAKAMGYGHMFVNERDGYITDDHLFVNMNARIPTIDIINRRANQEFGVHWHTHMDDLNVIDKNTLRAVTKVVQKVVADFDEGIF
jgi:hypothetical protein